MSLGELLGRGAFGRVYKGARGLSLELRCPALLPLLQALHAASMRCLPRRPPPRALACAHRAPMPCLHLTHAASARHLAGRWRGALVAVKVVEHRVQPGQSVDLSREPLLSMSVSHPHVVQVSSGCVFAGLCRWLAFCQAVLIDAHAQAAAAACPRLHPPPSTHPSPLPSLPTPQTHKICVCRLSIGDGGEERGREEPPAKGGSGSGSGSGGKLASGGSTAVKVPAPDGSGDTVEIVEPNEVLQPG